MRRQTARPLRACAALLLLYIGARVTVGAEYPELAIAALTPVRLLPPTGVGTVAIASVTAGPLVAATRAFGAAANLLPASLRSSPVPPPRYVLAVAVPARAPVHQSRRAEAAPPAGKAEPAAIVSAVEPVAAGATTASSMATVAVASPLQPQTLAAQPPATVAAARPRTFSGSAWLLAREGSGATPLATGGTLGGSQVGARLNWRPTAAPLILTVRASAALARRDSEIAPGIGIQGKAGGIILEQRLPLERGRRSRPALVVFGGFGDKAGPLGFRYDGYAQAGAVGVNKPALFADGALRMEREVVAVDRVRIGAGAGVWGAAQPRLSRLDVGPQLVAHLPIGGRAVRASAEYRVRVAGNVRPDSGFTFTLGTDF